MASLRDIQHKINGVSKTKQITKAMNMVASAKLRGAQAKIERFRPYAEKYFEVLSDLSSGAGSSAHPLLEVHAAIKTVAIILITSDKGLCGSFNANLCAAAKKLALKKKAEGKDVKFICVGKKGRDFIRKTEFEILEHYVEAMNHFDFQLASDIGSKVIRGYLDENLDEVYVLFGKFINIMRQEPELSAILPVRYEKTETAQQVMSKEYIFEPSVEGLMAEILPRYVNVLIYRGLLDTSASEHAARMAAMDNATKNCDEMVRDLTLVYNKARQTSITTQLIDIVGGAEALQTA